MRQGKNSGDARVVARCAIYHQAGDCVMPKEGIFAKVLRAGIVVPGDAVGRILPELERAS